ncbi:hypothetical protein HELRODRAFT_181690 [Helobdella robusta]|uniref:Uncharacterized protein n=1 Tax=Helobdella robusta TaxID=6412 RepID=T1FH86_HELRO|nr:hypothetical protein HELRODRAFT_181690 [Helobdella robusta]ESN92220.1 hypothetical protein HELRODRAFT_181690 [Helobdella robusta]
MAKWLKWPVTNISSLRAGFNCGDHYVGSFSQISSSNKNPPYSNNSISLAVGGEKRRYNNSYHNDDSFYYRRNILGEDATMKKSRTKNIYNNNPCNNIYMDNIHNNNNSSNIHNNNSNIHNNNSININNNKLKKFPFLRNQTDPRKTILIPTTSTTTTATSTTTTATSTTTATTTATTKHRQHSDKNKRLNLSQENASKFVKNARQICNEKLQLSLHSDRNCTKPCRISLPVMSSLSKSHDHIPVEVMANRGVFAGGRKFEGPRKISKPANYPAATTGSGSSGDGRDIGVHSKNENRQRLNCVSVEAYVDGEDFEICRRDDVKCHFVPVPNMKDARRKFFESNPNSNYSNNNNNINNNNINNNNINNNNINNNSINSIIKNNNNNSININNNNSIINNNNNNSNTNNIQQRLTFADQSYTDSKHNDVGNFFFGNRMTSSSTKYLDRFSLNVTSVDKSGDFLSQLNYEPKMLQIGSRSTSTCNINKNDVIINNNNNNNNNNIIINNKIGVNNNNNINNTDANFSKSRQPTTYQFPDLAPSRRASLFTSSTTMTSFPAAISTTSTYHKSFNPAQTYQQKITTATMSAAAAATPSAITSSSFSLSFSTSPWKLQTSSTTTPSPTKISTTTTPTPTTTKPTKTPKRESQDSGFDMRLEDSKISDDIITPSYPTPLQHIPFSTRPIPTSSHDVIFSDSAAPRRSYNFVPPVPKLSQNSINSDFSHPPSFPTSSSPSYSSSSLLSHSRINTANASKNSQVSGADAPNTGCILRNKNSRSGGSSNYSSSISNNLYGHYINNFGNVNNEIFSNNVRNFYNNINNINRSNNYTTRSHYFSTLTMSYNNRYSSCFPYYSHNNNRFSGTNIEFGFRPILHRPLSSTLPRLTIAEYPIFRIEYGSFGKFKKLSKKFGNLKRININIYHSANAFYGIVNKNTSAQVSTSSSSVVQSSSSSSSSVLQSSSSSAMPPVAAPPLPSSSSSSRPASETNIVEKNHSEIPKKFKNSPNNKSNNHKNILDQRWLDENTERIRNLERLLYRVGANTVASYHLREYLPKRIMTSSFLWQQRHQQKITNNEKDSGNKIIEIKNNNNNNKDNHNLNLESRNYGDDDDDEDHDDDDDDDEGEKDGKKMELDEDDDDEDKDDDEDDDEDEDDDSCGCLKFRNSDNDLLSLEECKVTLISLFIRRDNLLTCLKKRFVSLLNQSKSTREKIAGQLEERLVDREKERLLSFIQGCDQLTKLILLLSQRMAKCHSEMVTMTSSSATTTSTTTNIASSSSSSAATATTKMINDNTIDNRNEISINNIEATTTTTNTTTATTITAAATNTTTTNNNTTATTTTTSTTTASNTITYNNNNNTTETCNIVDWSVDIDLTTTATTTTTVVAAIVTTATTATCSSGYTSSGNSTTFKATMTSLSLPSSSSSKLKDLKTKLKDAQHLKHSIELKGLVLYERFIENFRETDDTNNNNNGSSRSSNHNSDNNNVSSHSSNNNNINKNSSSNNINKDSNNNKNSNNNDNNIDTFFNATTASFILPMVERWCCEEIRWGTDVLGELKNIIITTTTTNNNNTTNKNNNNNNIPDNDDGDDEDDHENKV